jgi:hypothetical protein
VTRLLGFSTIAAAFGLAIYGIVIATIGARRGDARLVRSARAVAYVNLELLTVSNVAMVYALVAGDVEVGAGAPGGRPRPPAPPRGRPAPGAPRAPPRPGGVPPPPLGGGGRAGSR